MNRKFQQYGDNTGSRNDGRENMKFRNQNGNRRPPSTNQQQQQQDVPKITSQTCIVCSKSSVCVCSRCGDYYCSPTCQQEDWQSHRYICFAMPSLVPVNYRPMKPSDIPQLHFGNNFDSSKKEKEIPVGQNTFANRESVSANTNLPNQTQQDAFLGPIPYAEYPKDKSHVMVTGFRTPNRCFIRSLEPTSHNAFFKCCKIIEAFGRNAPKLQNLPKPGQFALAMFQSDGLFYRVEVLGARNAENIRVLYIDYGSTASKKLSDLKQMPDELRKLQRYVLPVCLKDVPNFTMDENISKILISYDNMECKIEYTKNDKYGKECILRSWSTDESLNEKLAELDTGKSSVYQKPGGGSEKGDDDNHSSSGNKQDFKKGKPKSPYNKQDTRKNSNSEKIDKTEEIVNVRNEQIKKPEPVLNTKVTESNLNRKAETSDGPPNQLIKSVLTPPFEIIPFAKTAENFQVVSLDDSNIIYGYFGCIALSDLKNFQQVQEYLQVYEDTKCPYTPKKDEYCLAKFEDEWFRAKVIEILEAPDSFSVVYIDYTNESIVTSADIRKYPKDFKLPCTTNLCMIEGLPDEISPKLLKYLKGRLGCHDSVHKISKVVKFEENVALVKMDELLDELKGESLL